MERCANTQEQFAMVKVQSSLMGEGLREITFKVNDSSSSLSYVAHEHRTRLYAVEGTDLWRASVDTTKERNSHHFSLRLSEAATLAESLDRSVQLAKSHLETLRQASHKAAKAIGARGGVQ